MPSLMIALLVASCSSASVPATTPNAVAADPTIATAAAARANAATWNRITSLEVGIYKALTEWGSGTGGNRTAHVDDLLDKSRELVRATELLASRAGSERCVQRARRAARGLDSAIRASLDVHEMGMVSHAADMVSRAMTNLAASRRECLVPDPPDRTEDPTEDPPPPKQDDDPIPAPPLPLKGPSSCRYSSAFHQHADECQKLGFTYVEKWLVDWPGTPDVSRVVVAGRFRIVLVNKRVAVLDAATREPVVGSVVRLSSRSTAIGVHGDSVYAVVGGRALRVLTLLPDGKLSDSRPDFRLPVERVEDMVVDGELIFLTAPGHLVIVRDANDEPTVVADVKLPAGGECIAKAASLVVVCDHRHGLAAVDVRNPTAPRLVASVAQVEGLGGKAGTEKLEPRGAVLDGDRLYVANGGEHGLLVYQITRNGFTLVAETTLALAPEESSADIVGLARSGTQLYVADRNALHVVDVANPRAPRVERLFWLHAVVGVVTEPGVQDRVWVTTREQGLQLVDAGGGATGSAPRSR
jgi:hypothetical protein